jgi:hypothetical protein
MGVLAIASLFAILAAIAGDYLGATIGLLVAGAGAMELHGAGLLRQGDFRGMQWLPLSQLLLLASILTYCAFRAYQFDLPPIPDHLAPVIELSAAQAGLTPEQYLKAVYRLVIGFVALASVLYQGGMTLYYLRRRAPVWRALEQASGVER